MTMGRDSAEASLLRDVVETVQQHASGIARDVELEVLRDVQLSYRDWRVLAYLSAQPHAHPSKVAHALCSPKGSLSGVLDRLQDRGLLRREPDAADLRRTRLVLTPAGRQLVKRWAPAVGLVEVRRYADLSPHALQLMREALAADPVAVPSVTTLEAS